MLTAGMTITITSVTDLFAFGIGASSSLPILSSFSLYAAIGIFSVYLYIISFFLAWFTLDQRRIDDGRDGCICCLKMKKNTSFPEEPNNADENNNSVIETLFTFYADILTLNCSKIIILCSSAVILILSIYGVTQLEAGFDNLEWLPEESNLVQFYSANHKYFPSSGGSRGNIFVADVPNIETKLDKINQILSNVEKEEDVETVASFLPPFAAFVKMVSI